MAGCDICITDAEVALFLDEARKRHITVGTAESCTAGLISGRIADIPGSSDILRGGIVSYANEVKTGVLGVKDGTLRTYGAVSENCAREMAEGARRVLGSDVAVSVTGIAGPGGGSEKKPVGTVCFGVSGAAGTVTDTVHFDSALDRSAIRAQTVRTAIEKLLAYIRENY